MRGDGGTVESDRRESKLPRSPETTGNAPIKLAARFLGEEALHPGCIPAPHVLIEEELVELRENFISRCCCDALYATVALQPAIMAPKALLTKSVLNQRHVHVRRIYTPDRAGVQAIDLRDHL